LQLSEDKYERYFKRPRPTAASKNEIDKFDILANDKRIVVPAGALNAKGGKDDEES
tara:strand:- start:116 stop:283 length:168 start_codon:yes stop_codon:yes gene_type:complete